MSMIANLLALALIVADEPPAPPAPPADVPGMPMPKVHKPRGGNPVAEEPWNLTLRDAIRIGLDNSKVVRVIRVIGASPGGGFPLDESRPTTPDNVAIRFWFPMAPGVDVTIAPLDRDASIGNFKSAIMAHVRSIEQQYWSLSQQQTALWSRQTAVKLGTEILARERDELAAGRSNVADVAEAEQRLENFKLNLVGATSDAITTKRQLCNILGLPAADNRRIIPTTAPTEAKLDPNWEDCLAAMDASQPDIAQQRRLVRVAEFKALIEGENPNLPVEQREAARHGLEEQQASLEQVRHQATHSLARFFLEIDANYKQFQSARKLQDAAQKRLETQRAFYEEGRITVDRLLDAVGQYANAVAQESQYKSNYNTSIAALEEAKGTLLAHDKITVADPPRRKAYISAKVDQIAPAAFEAPIPAATRPGTRTFKIKARLVPGGLDLDIEVREGPAATPVDQGH